ncbi:hypothetical protein Acr_08g0006890 [Actinidia rufa]|nr:hypothetical protein Acr_08g0006890 [Actinidia rufa]
MDSQGGDTYYANLLSESSNHEDELRMEFSNQRNQASHISQKSGSTTNRSQRGTNFTIEEDILLISAWLNISLDAVQGNEQKHKTYWLRVWEYFHEHKKVVSDRTQTSLMHRWSTIQIATNKFCGCYAQIESKHNSDVAEKDQVIQAKIMYRELYGSSFPFEHCWNELRYHPKWLDESQRKRPKKNRSATPYTSAPSTPDTINILGDEEASHDTSVDLERPSSNKVENDLLTKRKSKDLANDYKSSPLAVLLHDLKEEETKMNEKKMEMYEKTYLQEQERLALEQQKLALTQLKEEERIMLMDTSGMPDHQAEYYRRRQMKIIGKGFTNVNN